MSLLAFLCICISAGATFGLGVRYLRDGRQVCSAMPIRVNLIALMPLTLP